MSCGSRSPMPTRCRAPSHQVEQLSDSEAEALLERGGVEPPEDAAREDAPSHSG